MSKERARVRFLFQGSLEIFSHTFCSKVFNRCVAENFPASLVDRYATFRQGPEGRLKFSGQGPADFFQSRSARNFSIKIRLQIFKQGLMHFSRTPARRRGRCGFMFQSRSDYFFSVRVCSKVFNQRVVENFQVKSD